MKLSFKNKSLHVPVKVIVKSKDIDDEDLGFCLNAETFNPLTVFDKPTVSQPLVSNEDFSGNVEAGLIEVTQSSYDDVDVFLKFDLIINDQVYRMIKAEHEIGGEFTFLTIPGLITVSSAAPFAKTEAGWVVYNLVTPTLKDDPRLEMSVNVDTGVSADAYTITISDAWVNYSPYSNLSERTNFEIDLITNLLYGDALDTGIIDSASLLQETVNVDTDQYSLRIDNKTYREINTTQLVNILEEHDIQVVPMGNFVFTLDDAEADDEIILDVPDGGLFNIFIDDTESPAFSNVLGSNLADSIASDTSLPVTAFHRDDYSFKNSRDKIYVANTANINVITEQFDEPILTNGTMEDLLDILDASSISTIKVFKTFTVSSSDTNNAKGILIDTPTALYINDTPYFEDDSRHDISTGLVGNYSDVTISESNGSYAFTYTGSKKVYVRVRCAPAGKIEVDEDIVGNPPFALDLRDVVFMLNDEV